MMTGSTTIAWLAQSFWREVELHVGRENLKYWPWHPQHSHPTAPLSWGHLGPVITRVRRAVLLLRILQTFQPMSPMFKGEASVWLMSEADEEIPRWWLQGGSRKHAS
jgi:hypothetical protein